MSQAQAIVAGILIAMSGKRSGDFSCMADVLGNYGGFQFRNAYPLCVFRCAADPAMRCRERPLCALQQNEN